ncbi:MAG: hypothetical protein ACOVME_03450, partial [Rhodobacter sp.]
MGHAGLAIGGLADHVRLLAPQSWLLVVLALALGTVGGGASDDLVKALVFAGAATFVALALTIYLGMHLARYAVRREESLLAALFGEDPAPI